MSSVLIYNPSTIKWIRESCLNQIGPLIKRNQPFVTQESIFCYFDHFDDAEQHLKWNKAVFIVCHPEIWTQSEAEIHVNKWLYMDGKLVEGANGKPFEQMVGRSKEAALKHIIISSISEGIEQKKKQAISC